MENYQVFIAALEGAIDPALSSGATQIPRNLSKGSSLLKGNKNT